MWRIFKKIVEYVMGSGPCMGFFFKKFVACVEQIFSNDFY